MTRRRAVGAPGPAGPDLPTDAAAAGGADAPLRGLTAAEMARAMDAAAAGGADAPALAVVLGAHCAAGLALPHDVLLELVRVLYAYNMGRIDEHELVRRLGLAEPSRTRARRRRNERAQLVRDEVDRWHRQGFRKSNPATTPDTAFHRAADALGMPTATLYDVYRGKR